MDLYSLGNFKKYKSDWKLQVRCQENIKSGKKCSDFQSAIKDTIIVGQCFGLNPVIGFRGKDASEVSFKFKSWRCIYTFLTILGQIVMVFFLILRLFKSSSSTVDASTDIIFYSLGLSTTIIFLYIARKWPKLCMEISKIEATDPTTDSKLRIKFNTSCCVILMLALLEHLLSELHGIALAIDCEPGTPIYETYIKRSFQWIFIAIPYSTLVGVLSHFINIQCTFNWNFTDLFVICMSIYLTSRFEQVNQRVIAAKDKHLPPAFWRTIREDYNKTSYLVRKVNNIIGGIIFISFANNLFFVCSQLLHTLAYMSGYEHVIYFVYSFIFLVARSLAVSLTASRVHSASLEPAFALYDVSSATYCIEIKRFLDQIHSDTVALSGLKFFNVKRGLILTIAGTIVTYELVLMQFTGVTPTSPPPL